MIPVLSRARLLLRQTWDLWANAGGSSTSLLAWDAAKAGDRLKRWWPPSTNFVSVLSPQLLKARARDADRNNPWAHRAVDLLRDYVVSVGVKPTVDLPDPKLRALVHAKWTAWTDSADFDGISDYYGLQARCFRAALVDGESLLFIRPGPTLQLQLLPSEFLDTSRDNAVDIAGGIQFDAEGRRAGYWLYQKSPAAPLVPISQFVPADRVVHLYSPTQPGFMRGTSWLAPALLALFELQTYMETALVRARTGSLFAGFIRSADESPILVNDSGEPDFEPGSMARLRPGDELQLTSPPDPTQGYAPFIATQLRSIAAALGVPYELLSGDLSQITFASGREGLLAFQRSVGAIVQNVLVYQACRPVWRWWLGIAIAAGELPETVLAAPMRWVSRPIETLDSRMATQSTVQKIRAGLMSRSEAVAGFGLDPEALDLEIQSDNQRADRLGLIYDSDARRVTLQGLEQPSDAKVQ